MAKAYPAMWAGGMGNVAAPVTMVTCALPTGEEINVAETGIECRLHTFITDAGRPADKTTWFDFDRLLFATDSAHLLPASQEQLQHVANILKAYPNVKVKVGGYTDNTGDPAYNLNLSDARAKNVRQALIDLGIDAGRMEAEGYGEQFPVGDNSTAEGRQQNRRISLRVTEK
jgi:outer membrane protein OmpA-like peptidoglycan-associated protein